MKATGIVRRIDDLGRVVIPKEIRRTMRIREGDPLEIFTDNDGEVIFKKYSPIGELGNFATQYSDVLYKTGGYPVLVCDRDHVVAVSGLSKKEIIERELPDSPADLTEYYANLRDAIDGKAELIVKPEQVRAVFTVLEAMFKSAKTGEMVKL